jgi:hypothetical protein
MEMISGAKGVSGVERATESKGIHLNHQSCLHDVQWCCYSTGNSTYRKKHFDQKEEIKTPQRERAARWSGSDMRL